MGIASRLTDSITRLTVEILHPFAKWAKEHASEISELDENTIVQRLANELQISAPQTASVVTPLTGAQPALPPALINTGFQMNIPGLGMAVPKGTRAKSTTTVAKATNQKWVSIERFDEMRQSAEGPLCAYVPPRGGNKDTVCAAPATNADKPGVDDYTKYRCDSCKEKRGQLVTKIEKASSGKGFAPQNVIPGINAINGGQIGTLPSLNAQIPALGAPSIPALSGMPSLAGMPNLSQLMAPPQPAPQPVVEEEAKEFEAVKNDTLKPIHVLPHPNMGAIVSNWIIDIEQGSCIGKYPENVNATFKFPSDYESKLIALSPKEKEHCEKLGISYTFTVAVPSIPNLTASATIGSIGVPSLTSLVSQIQ